MFGVLLRAKLLCNSGHMRALAANLLSTHRFGRGTVPETPCGRRHASYAIKELTMANSPTNGVSNVFVVTHPLDPEDGKITEMMRAGASSTKGKKLGIE